MEKGLQRRLDLIETTKLIGMYLIVGVVAGLGAIVFQQRLSLMNIYEKQVHSRGNVLDAEVTGRYTGRPRG